MNEKKNTAKRRSALRIMGSLIGLVKPLLHIMMAAIILGTMGYLCAIFLTILAGQVIIHGLLTGAAGTSLSVQNMWFTSSRTLPRSGIPLEYVDVDGVTHPWTDLAAADPYLKQLIRTYSSTAFEERRVPAESNFNLKATKKLWNDRLGIALYVNRLLNISPDYYITGILQRRYSSPYFGMELNLKL